MFPFLCHLGMGGKQDLPRERRRRRRGGRGGKGRRRRRRRGEEERGGEEKKQIEEYLGRGDQREAEGTNVLSTQVSQ